MDSASLRNPQLSDIDDDIIDQIFDFLVRDFSKFALKLYTKNGSTIAQQNACLKMIVNKVVMKMIYKDQNEFGKKLKNLTVLTI